MKCETKVYFRFSLPLKIFQKSHDDHDLFHGTKLRRCRLELYKNDFEAQIITAISKSNVISPYGLFYV